MFCQASISIKRNKIDETKTASGEPNEWTTTPSVNNRLQFAQFGSTECRSQSSTMAVSCPLGVSAEIDRSADTERSFRRGRIENCNKSYAEMIQKLGKGMVFFLLLCSEPSAILLLSNLRWMMLFLLLLKVNSWKVSINSFGRILFAPTLPIRQQQWTTRIVVIITSANYEPHPTNPHCITWLEIDHVVDITARLFSFSTSYSWNRVSTAFHSIVGAKQTGNRNDVHLGLHFWQNN